MSNPAAYAAASMTLPEKVVSHIQHVDYALEKAAAAETKANEKQAQVDALIPSVVDVMVQCERILPTQREKLAEMLKDPVQVLELMKKVAGHRNQEELAKLGTGMPQQKTAGAVARPYDPQNSLTDPYVGGRTNRVKQSSVVLFQGLGLNPPTE